MKNNSTLSCIQAFSDDATDDLLQLAKGLLDTEADQSRSPISENELSPYTRSTILRLQSAAEPVIEIDNEVFLIEGRPIFSWCDWESLVLTYYQGAARKAK